MLRKRGLYFLSASYSSARYYHSDHVGSNTLVTRSDGSTVQESVLDPFGELLHQPLTSASNAYLFTDQERDGETGLDYFGARYYDPWVGRFMSVDPESLGGITFSRQGWDTQNANVYSYVRNSPTVLTDPTGRCSQYDAYACSGFSGATSTHISGDGTTTTTVQNSDSVETSTSGGVGRSVGAGLQGSPVRVDPEGQIAGSFTATNEPVTFTGSVNVPLDGSGRGSVSFGIGVGEGNSNGGSISGEVGATISGGNDVDTGGYDVSIATQITKPAGNVGPVPMQTVTTISANFGSETGTATFTVQPGTGSSTFHGVLVTAPIQLPGPIVRFWPSVHGPIIVPVVE